MRLQIVSLSVGLFLAGCAFFDPDRPIELIKPQDGWTRITAPADEDALLAAASQDDDVRNLLDDNARFKRLWFQRGPDDYLIYFMTHAYTADSCQYAYELVRVNTQWGIKPHKHGICT